MSVNRFSCVVTTWLLLATTATAAEPLVNVRDLGAAADGRTLCTEILQQAIDRCSQAGGGTVYFPPGTYLSGTIFMKSRVTLNLDAGATLLGSPRKDDYPVTIPQKVDSRTNQYNHRSMIYAENLDRIAIVGRGTLDGSGAAFMDKRHDGRRPLILRVINCRDVLVQDIQMQNSGFWNQHYLHCDRVLVRGIRVFNHATYNVDGIDIDGCHDFVLTDSFIDSDDDAICLKSTSNRPCENILISNCVVSSHCNAVKFGTDSSGGFVNVTITNCSIVAPRYSKVIYGRQRGISGLSFELVDGGRIDRVAVSNVTIDGVEVPIFVRLGNRGCGFTLADRKTKKEIPIGTLRNVMFSNVIATRAGKTGCSLVGLLGHAIENVTLSNVTIRSEGGGERERASAKIKEIPEGYPEATMFGNLPAYGLYCRHVRGLTLSGVRLETDQPDGRHALALDDVQNVDISSLNCSYSTGAAPLIGLLQTRNVLIHGCRPSAPDGVLLRIRGKKTVSIALAGNDLTQVAAISEFAEDGDPAALQMRGNLPPNQRLNEQESPK
jgi:polygalacturonase